MEKQLEQFQKEYIELCKKYGLAHSCEPVWRLSQETNDFRLQIITKIVKINNGKETDNKSTNSK